MEKSISNIRKNIIRVAFNCKGKVHWGSALSCVEIMYVLYGIVTNVADDKISNNERDEIIVSKGQAALAMYAAMHEAGMINDTFISEFQKDGNEFPEEVMNNHEMRIPCSTGSLGIGMPYAVGVALRKKRRKESGKVYTVVGDGECDEGSIWEAAMCASNYGLDNLTMIVDYNGLQADGGTDDVMKLGDISQKFLSFGWSVTEVDGHNCDELIKAFKYTEGKPHVIIAKTIKGRGISFMENDYRWHDNVLDKDFLKQACKEVGIDYVGD